MPTDSSMRRFTSGGTGGTGGTGGGGGGGTVRLHLALSRATKMPTMLGNMSRT